MLTEESRRRDFPVLEGKTYLNTAAEGIPPTVVIHALAEYGRDKLLGMDGRALHAAVWDSAKRELALAYGLTAEEVSFCSCSSEAYNLAALALNLKDGDEVIVNDLDFPSGATPWLQPNCPAKVGVWRSRDGALRIEDLIPLLNSRTRLVTTSLVSLFNGYKVSLPALTDAVRKHSSALLSVDVTQALGRIPLDLTDVDLVVSSTHKWILASHGGGLVGVPAARAEAWTAHAGGWFNRKDAFGVDRFQQTATKPGAASFSVGMPNYPAVYAINAGLQYIRETGVANIDDHCQPLMRHCMDSIARLPVTVLTPNEPESMAGIIAFLHPQSDRVAQALHEKNIHVMCHAGRLRIAIHGYNTTDDIERLLRVMRDVVK